MQFKKTEAYFLSNIVVFRWSENGLLKEKDRLNFGLAENYYGKHPVKKDYSRLNFRKAIHLNRFPELFVSLTDNDQNFTKNSASTGR